MNSIKNNVTPEVLNKKKLTIKAFYSCQSFWKEEFQYFKKLLCNAVNRLLLFNNYINNLLRYNNNF